MKKKFIIIAVIFLLILSGCTGLVGGEKSEFLNISIGKVSDWDWNWDLGYNCPTAQIEYPLINMNEADTQKYPELSLAIDDINNDMLQYYDGKLEEFRQDYDFSEYNPEYFGVLTDRYNVKVRRADKAVLSLLFENFTHFGGVHGNNFFFGETYDTRTGEKLSLSDVVNDVTVLPDLVEENLKRYWSDVKFFEDYDVKSMFEEETVQWTLDYSGITFYFNIYDLAPYSEGAQVITLTKEEYPEILKTEYMASPSSYSFELTKGLPFFCDIYNDAVTDMVKVYAYSDDYSGSGQITININDMTYTEDLYLYVGDFNFVSTEDGNKLILLELSQDGDYHVIYVYDISSGVRKLGEIEGRMKCFYDENDSVLVESVLTNPGEFYIETRTNILSTVDGDKKYYIGEDGMPEPYDTKLILNKDSAPELTLLMDFEAEVYDEKKDKVVAKRVLSKGEKVIYYATDEDKYVFFKCEDGAIVRKEYTRQELSISIDGIDMWEVFDGLIFAG